MKKDKPKELPTLTEYHWQRNKDAQKGADEMAKHPYTLQQKKEQVERLTKQKKSNQ